MLKKSFSNNKKKHLGQSYILKPIKIEKKNDLNF